MSGTTVGRGTALLVAGTFFMENLDGTILTTAVPKHRPVRCRCRPPRSAPAITAYLVTLAVLIPLSGWLTERFGARRVLLTAIALFTLASALCAVAPGLPEADRRPGAAGRRRRPDGARRPPRRAARDRGRPTSCGSSRCSRGPRSPHR